MKFRYLYHDKLIRWLPGGIRCFDAQQVPGNCLERYHDDNSILLQETAAACQVAGNDDV